MRRFPEMPTDIDPFSVAAYEDLGATAGFYYRFAAALGFKDIGVVKNRRVAE
jgi:hypothetical protein